MAIFQTFIRLISTIKNLIHAPLFLLIALLSLESKAQQTTQMESETQLYTIVEEMPEFPGGHEALIKYLNTNIKYPEEARKMGLEGKVFVQFVVTKTGTIQNIKVIRGIEDGEALEKEAMRVMQAMPNWKPGKMDGKAINTSLTLPISFKLSDALNSDTK